MPHPTLLRLLCLRAALAPLCALLAWLGPLPANAQTALPASLQSEGPSAAEKRAELYRTLQQQAQILEAQSAVVKTVAKLVGPTVVHVEADVEVRAARSSRSPEASPRRNLEEAGSGVVIQRDGKFYVLTNCHVIRDSRREQVRITLADGRMLHPAQVWMDKETDVAVMAISASDLVAAPLGDSDRMEIGDFVLAVGSPFNQRGSVTFGIVSAKGRRDLQLGDDNAVNFQDFLQTDAAINPGNSGGPLVNLRGEVIGINTAIASNSGGNEGIGFAIPVNMFMFVTRQLLAYGKVTRAFLGVHLDQKFGPAMATELGLPRPCGARITGITRGTPAEIAGLQVGDVILEFNSIPVQDDTHLITLVSLTEVGKKLPLVILRDRKPLTLQLEVTDRGRYLRESQ